MCTYSVDSQAIQPVQSQKNEECSLTLQPFLRLQWTLLGNPRCATPHFFEQSTLRKLGNAPQCTDRERVPTHGQQLCF